MSTYYEPKSMGLNVLGNIYYRWINWKSEMWGWGATPMLEDLCTTMTT